MGSRKHEVAMVFSLFVLMLTSYELPPNQLKRCHYGSHTKMDGIYHEMEHETYHCHLWEKRYKKGVMYDQLVNIPYYMEIKDGKDS